MQRLGRYGQLTRCGARVGPAHHRVIASHGRFRVSAEPSVSCTETVTRFKEVEVQEHLLVATGGDRDSQAPSQLPARLAMKLQA